MYDLIQQTGDLQSGRRKLHGTVSKFLFLTLTQGSSCYRQKSSSSVSKLCNKKMKNKIQ